MSFNWSQWLQNIPADQITLLSQALRERTEEVRDIPIICTPAEEMYVREAKPYVDVYGLIPQYEKLAFSDHGNLLLKGPKGNGKSLSIRSFAAKYSLPLVVVECSENTKDLQLLGRYVMLGRETHFVLTGLTKAIKVANEVGYCILLLEEFNALTPQSQKLLNGVLQERAVEVDALGRTYRLDPGKFVWFTGTMNPSAYGGTYDLNEDLKSRMGEIDIDYPSFELEKQIVRANCSEVDESLVDLVLRFAKETRQQATGYSLSTRDVVRTINTIKSNGLDVALQMLVCKFEGDDRSTAAARMNSIFPSTQVRKSWGGIRL